MSKPDDGYSQLKAELAALRLVHQEARELIGEADATGTIPTANLEALRSLLFRASIIDSRPKQGAPWQVVQIVDNWRPQLMKAQPDITWLLELWVELQVALGVPSEDGRAEQRLEAKARLSAAASDLLAACKMAHDAIDMLFAMLVRLDREFAPSRSGQPWEALLAGNAAIAKAEER
jgi:hypothetical protein